MLVRSPLTRVLLLGCVLAPLACSERPEEDLEKARAAAQQAGGVLAEGAEVARPYAEKGVEMARPYAEQAASATRDWLDEQLPMSGELSSSARGWLRETAGDEAADNAEAWVLKGKQLTAAASEVGGTLNAAVERDWACEPILQLVEDPSAQAQLDGVIGDMPRVETVEGLSIGFKNIGGQTATGTEKDRGLLVLWRRDDHLYGFVLRARRKVDMELLVREMPRLMKIVEAAL